ncbi:uncharacterized protein LOC106163246 isoform X2 [Lingula anatina]|uniref:Uncharacterized protein LOC106163246 isoform X2 n=1 Tax=Lingula anatina TaxID=7574 RepID=A0A1S3IDA1_LINAN|nr:uncharacterized protein LOC106163246 isoform X2 [Lingula anatina]|eukprot:XP_013396240.1 uncharacterized protein LOC106163246 isoform X2 [Lingula anatina]
MAEKVITEPCMEESTKDLMVKGKPAKLRSILVPDTTDTIPVSLWRDDSSSPVKVGNCVEFKYRISFNSFEERLVCHINGSRDVEQRPTSSQRHTARSTDSRLCSYSSQQPTA